MLQATNGWMLIALLGVLLAGGLAWYLRARYQYALAHERRCRAHLLEDSSMLRPLGDSWTRAYGCGQLAFLVVGSYGARQLPYILKTFERSGAADHVGMIYL